MNHHPTLSIVIAFRYYRSGNELYKMAKIYLSEGNLENAYILLMRFLTIFVERIKKHPGYNEVPAETKKTITVKVKEIMPITEQLKAKLKQRYKKEYEEFLVEQENEKKQALEEEKRREKEAARNKTPAKIISPNVPSGFEPTAPVLNDIVYPNDFPSNEPQKSSGLLPGTKPSFDRTSKPLTKSLMEGGLRLIKIPDDTMIKFLEVARPNTLKNVETCGILAGQLKQHELLITHVILPKQSGSADSCITMHEEEIFDIQDSLNLITLGWIHTHPTQSAFLSSVDLHTQAGYQIMMPEVSFPIPYSNHVVLIFFIFRQ